MPLEPLICRSRYRNAKKGYNNKRKFGKLEKTHTFAMVKKQRVLTVLYRTIKSKKLWQQQIGQLLQKEKTTEQ